MGDNGMVGIKNILKYILFCGIVFVESFVFAGISYILGYLQYSVHDPNPDLQIFNVINNSYIQLGIFIVLHTIIFIIVKKKLIGFGFLKNIIIYVVSIVVMVILEFFVGWEIAFYGFY